MCHFCSTCTSWSTPPPKKKIKQNNLPYLQNLGLPNVLSYLHYQVLVDFYNQHWNRLSDIEPYAKTIDIDK